VKRRWIKRIIIAASAIVFLIAVATMTGISLYRGQPTWYRPNFGTPEERRAAAQMAEVKFQNITNWASKQRAVEDSARYAARNGATLPATTSASDELQVSFTEQELNAFVEKWSVIYDWRNKYGEVLTDPTVVLQKDRLILAGKLKEMDTVASIHFAPSLDENGKLHLDLAGLQAGRLPLPEAFWVPKREKILAQLRMSLPQWQRTAKIDANGSTNGSAMSAAFSRMLLESSRGEPTDAVLFLPLLDNDRAVPVKLTSIQISPGELNLTVRPMGSKERRQLLDRIKSRTNSQTVAAQ
jgi:hypothetical protein